MKKHTITSALPYANGPLHLGHLAGAYLPADIYARTLRLLGKDVVFICGSDEHGAAISVRAKKEGKTPQEIIDKYHFLNKNTFERLGISFDIFHRTSDPLHHQTAQDFFKKLYEKGGEFEEIESEQYYDEPASQFLADRFIVGTCPKCGNQEAYGDQCEKCGSDLSPSELINPRSTLSGATPVLRKTKHWYFKLNKHEEWLRTWIAEGKLDGFLHHDAGEWRNHVKGQCLSWLDNGLHPRSITRDLDWGISVPLDTPDAKGKVLYVWFDAPIGYISATKQWAADNDKNWEDYWKGDSAELTHFIGKDNIVFHCIVFPSMLKAHGDFVLPVNVPANQFLNFEGRKFSKSKEWGIENHQYLNDFEAFENKEDALRFYLSLNLPEQKDGDFKWEEFTEAHDNYLVANIGNFVNRVLSLSHAYFGGVVPSFDDNMLIKGAQVDSELIAGDFFDTYLTPALHAFTNHIEHHNYKEALKSLLELSSVGNAFLQNNAPWAIYKANPDAPEVKAVIHLSLQLVTTLSVSLQPFLPFTAEKLRRFLALPALQNGDLKTLIENLKKRNSPLAEGHQTEKPSLLFAKINDPKDSTRKDLIEKQKIHLQQILEKEAAEQKAADKYKPMKEVIQYEDFEKMDLRTGTITAAEKVEKADKLLKLNIDLGFEQRTVVSGIALHFKPEEIIGKKVLLLANLAPRKLRGIDSQGMILMAEDAEGKLAFVSPPNDFESGMSVK